VGHWIEGNRLGVWLHVIGVGDVYNTPVAGHLTNRWGGRVRGKVPSSHNSARGAQLNL